MSLSLSHNSTFSFNGMTFYATSVTVEAAQPELADMTPGDASKNSVVMVPTGGYSSPGSVQVEAFGMTDPLGLIGTMGMAVFSTPLGTVSRRCICSSASVSGKVGDLLRISFSLTPTDYTG